MLVLAFSAISYLIAIGVIGGNPSKGRNIAKLFFWFFPMILDISSYFVIARWPDHVECPKDSIRKRSRTVFTIVLGAGLNQITGSFKYVVGAVGFTMNGVMVMISAAAIIILQATLYSRNNEKSWTGANPSHTYLWFFLHYIYLATLILTLQCIQYLLAFANLYAAIMAMLGMVFDVTNRAFRHGVTSITPDQYPKARDAFLALGLPIDDFLEFVNAALTQPGDANARTHLFQTLIYIACVTFYEFDAFPERGSVLYNKIQNFLSEPLVAHAAAYGLLGELLSSRLRLAFLFWGVAGATLIMLALLDWIQRRPLDGQRGMTSNKYRIVNRFFFGAVFVTLSVLTVGHNSPYFSNWSTALIDLNTATPWKFASSAWVIPGFAITLIVVNIIDMILRHLDDSKG